MFKFTALPVCPSAPKPYKGRARVLSACLILALTFSLLPISPWEPSPSVSANTTYNLRDVVNTTHTVTSGSYQLKATHSSTPLKTLNGIDYNYKISSHDQADPNGKPNKWVLFFTTKAAADITYTAPTTGLVQPTIPAYLTQTHTQSYTFGYSETCYDLTKFNLSDVVNTTHTIASGPYTIYAQHDSTTPLYTYNGVQYNYSITGYDANDPNGKPKRWGYYFTTRAANGVTYEASTTNLITPTISAHLTRTYHHVGIYSVSTHCYDYLTPVTGPLTMTIDIGTEPNLGTKITLEGGVPPVVSGSPSYEIKWYRGPTAGATTGTGVSEITTAKNFSYYSPTAEDRGCFITAVATAKGDCIGELTATTSAKVLVPMSAVTTTVNNTTYNGGIQTQKPSAQLNY